MVQTANCPNRAATARLARGVSRCLVVTASVLTFAVPSMQSAHAATRLPAEQPPGTSGSFSFHPSEAKRGDLIYFTGSCLWGGSANGVDMFVAAGPVRDLNYEGFFRHVTPAADGTVSGTLRVPEDAPAAAYIVSGTCFAGDQGFAETDGPFRVVGPPLITSPSPTTTPTPKASLTMAGKHSAPPTVAATRLPNTGSAVHSGITAAVAATTGGVAFLILGRTRRRRALRRPSQ
jgi:LPXTG-motif cell wall-anchored protein